MKTIRENKPIRITAGVMTAAVMTVIFILSAQPSERSSELSMSLLARFFDGDVQLLLHSLVRKLAHMAEYAALGFFSSLFAATLSEKKLPSAAASFGFSVLYACSDEFHQTFVRGRAGQLTDVLIDSAGAAAGMTVLFLIINIISKKIRK